MPAPKPKADFDWLVYDSRKNPVNGHVQSVFSIQTGQWSTPDFVESPVLSVHGLAPGLNYGQHIFEGLKAFRRPDDEIAVFRPGDHAARFQRSAAFLEMPEVPKSLFLQCVDLAVRRNAEYVPPHDVVGGSLYIRPLEFASSVQIGLDPPDEYMFCVYVQPHFGLHAVSSLKALVADEYDRVATRGAGKAKMGGNYACIPKWSRLAKEEGFNLLLHLDSSTQTKIEEFSTSGFVGIRDDGGGSVTALVSDSETVLDSITVDSMAVLATSFGWRVERRSINFAELTTITEAMAAGTASGVLSVSNIYRKSTGERFDLASGGPIYAKISGALRGIQRGAEQDRFGWCRVVEMN
ncbi:Putative aminotransferase class IV, branched-chain amino acid aminotransferase II [Colletotrichum destructivum]|uniref:Aminotransferase class IV, branched-chain amino acid aminotransferase II n=1 Tax=Colletotrichum destructivum TaxID=34406 RepID=A0AAX4J175_9PEZI|nr:Putative aminotransferase class IV, branched-chain amino acid aminotransferase II [Colletotrichum destructivum]